MIKLKQDLLKQDLENRFKYYPCKNKRQEQKYEFIRWLCLQMEKLRAFTHLEDVMSTAIASIARHE